MKIGIIQPYFFPYIGYFQLINNVDKFVIYDDVNFIKKGWINRNYFLSNGKAKLITIPCIKISQNKKINEIEVALDLKNKQNILKSLYDYYHTSPYFNDIFPIIERVINSTVKHIGEFSYNSIAEICEYLDINTQIIKTSTIFNNSDLKREYRLIDICKKTEHYHYINPIGGTKIYSKGYFQSKGIKLNFIKSKYIKYEQYGNTFIPDLSIIDVLMFNTKNKAQDYLEECNLI